MIAQLLNREFLLGAAAQARVGLKRELNQRNSGRRSGKPSPLRDLDDSELRDLLAELGKRGEEPEGLTERSEGAKPTPDAPPTVSRPKDDFAFVPRDALLSVLQTALDDFLEADHPEMIAVRRIPGDRRGPEDPPVTDRQLKAVGLRYTKGGRRLWKPFEVARPKVLSDPRWVSSLLAMGWRELRGRAAFIDDPPLIRIENKARVFLVGDWGSGLPRAQNVAARMAQELAKEDRVQQHVVHLGDVYYSGSKREYETRFLKYWPVKTGQDIGSYTLNGNHDMYTGGHAYYSTCLADPRFARQNGCSFFALQNDHWQFIALDSSYEDAGLHGRQTEWARQLIDSAPKAIKNVLLSHHQLFSAHEDGAKELGRKITPVLATNRVDAWFWGHEHRCIEYAPTHWNGMQIGFSSCVGHGGIPEYLIMKEGEEKPKPWVYEYLKQYGTGWEPWEMFGFAVLELSDDHMKVRYFDELGKEHHTVADITQVPK